MGEKYKDIYNINTQKYNIERSLIGIGSPQIRSQMLFARISILIM